MGNSRQNSNEWKLSDTVIQQKPGGMSQAINELQLLNSAQTGTIGVTLNMIGHSHDCDCDLQTWDCSKGPFHSIF